MTPRLCRALAAAAWLCAGGGATAAPPDAPAPAGPAEAFPAIPYDSVPFAALPGGDEDDLAAAFAAFKASCPAVGGALPPVRAAVPPSAALRAVCRRALALAAPVTKAKARRFFSRFFEPRRLAVAAFFTGYYEPVVEASLTRTAAFSSPLLAPPPGLEAAAPGAVARRRLADGTAVPVPDRAAIEAGALGAASVPLAWVRDPVEAFFIQVQGSARLRLPDGRLRRLAYAGRNGYPYTSIGKVLVDTLGIPPAQMGMSELKTWIRAHGQGPGDRGTELMRRNASFIFFRFDDALPPAAGPVGAAGVSLAPLRSLAVDRAVWAYGLPIYLDAELPWKSDKPDPLRRLMVAQDTGSAIVGPARADIFFGTGEPAAARAGAVRHRGTLFVLWPKEPGGAAGSAAR